MNIPDSEDMRSVATEVLSNKRERWIQKTGGKNHYMEQLEREERRIADLILETLGVLIPRQAKRGKFEVSIPFDFGMSPRQREQYAYGKIIPRPSEIADIVQSELGFGYKFRYVSYERDDPYPLGEGKELVREYICSW